MVALALVGCRERGETRTPESAHTAKASGDTTPGAAERPDGPADGELAPAAPRKRPPPAKVEDKDAAMKAVLTGNPEGAIAFLAEHVASNPSDLDARLALARARIVVGAHDEARAVLEDKRGAPDDARVIQLRAHLLRVRGDWKGTESLLENAIKLDPKAIAVRGDLLAVLLATGRKHDKRAKALMDGLYDEYEAGRAKTAADLLAVARAALARGTKGAFHDANMVLQEAEDLEPVKEGSWIGDEVVLLRGNVFLEKYAIEEAATTFGLLLARDPWHPDALVGMAQVEIDGLRFGPAGRIAEEALQVNPRHPDAHALLARVALIEGRRDEARKRVTEHVLAINPAHTAGLAVLAGLALLENRPKELARWRDAALAVNPRAGGFFEDLSDILAFLHLYPEADAVLREGEKLAPDDAYVQSALGLNLLRLGDEPGGRAALEKAWKGDPFNERTRNVLDLYEKSLDSRYSVKTVGDLTVRLPIADREIVEPVLLASIERSRDELDKLYRVKAGALRLEFFDTPEEFSVRTVGVPSLGAVAVCFGPLITFLGPHRGLFNSETVIRHELAHVYAIRRSGGRVPRWFTEGLSEWESELAEPAAAREAAEALVRARRAGRLRRLGELELAFIRAESGAAMEVAYSTSAYAVRWMGRTFGRDKLLAMLDGYKKGEDTPELFAKVLGKDLATVEREFEKWFAAELDAKISGWRPSDDPHPSDPRDAAWMEALAHAQKNENAEAIRTLEKLVASGGDGFGPRMVLAKLVADGPKPDAAQRHLEAARKFNKESIEPLVLLAELARKGDRASDEKKVLEQALAIDADSLEPAARLLMLALVTDDKDAEKIALRRVRAIAPLHPIALSADAIALVRAKKKDAAAARLERATKGLEGGPADTFVVAAMAAAAVGDKAKAKALAKLASDQGPLPTAARKKLDALRGKNAETDHARRRRARISRVHHG